MSPPATRDSSDPLGDSVSTFIFAQTQRTLDRQATVLAELRQRTSIILSATGIVASLFGAAALKDGHPRGVIYSALGATAAGIALCLFALRSVKDSAKDRNKREWKVTLSSPELDQLRRREKNLDGLVDGLKKWRQTNYDTIKSRARLVWLASFALPLQIALWAWAVLF